MFLLHAVMPQEPPIDDRIILLKGVATDDAATLQARHKHIISEPLFTCIMISVMNFICR